MKMITGLVLMLLSAPMVRDTAVSMSDGRDCTYEKETFLILLNTPYAFALNHGLKVAIGIKCDV